MPRKSAQCTVCERPMWRTTSLAEWPCCLPCRRSLSREDKLALGIVRPRRDRCRDRCYVYFGICRQCERPFASRTKDAHFCSRQCVGASQRVRPDSDSRVRRQRRALEAVGLTEHQRRKLLSKWRRQGRECIYCAGACDTIDHVFPLVRGGTNHEGNLAPCCKACNSSKAARLLVEWRVGLPADKTFTISPLRTVRPRVERKVQLLSEKCCHLCGVLYVGRGGKYCSAECLREAGRRQTRDRYRMAHGLPGIGAPTSKWRQERAVPRRRRRRIVAPVGQLELIA